jgi:DNA-binding response OmpR family regulator
MAHKKKILIIDDEKALLRILRIKLKVCGYEVSTASGGRQALELIAVELPDCVLLDIIMPGTDGFEVLQNLRLKSDLPVIAFSARPENEAKARQLGANGFVPKPFDMDSLIVQVHDMLERKPA